MRATWCITAPLLVLGALAFAGSALAIPDGWHKSMDDGLEAAAKSGKPLLVVTAWKDGVWKPCDTWRAQVQPDARILKLLHRYEPVEWHYDGLNGKIVKWTLENGGTSHDPSVLAFVVGRDGEVFSSLMKGKQYAASSFAKWMEEQADAYEKLHPATRLPFQRAKVAVRGDGTDRTYRCAALDEAKASKPVLLYFGRDRFEEGDKTGKKENKLSRSFVKRTLNSKSAEKESKGWVMLRFDLAEEEHAAFAKTLGVDAAPALLMWLPGKDEPEALNRRITGQSLAVILRKHRPE